MDITKVIGIAFISVIIIIILKQSKPEFAIHASIIAGIIILSMMMGYLEKIIDLIKTISSKANINSQFLEIILKITAIAILSEFSVSICKDSGENSIASKVDLSGKIIIITLSIPIINALLSTVLKILP